MAPVPPEPKAVAEPSFPPLHVTLVDPVTATVTAVGGCVIVAMATETHPLISETVQT